MPIDTARILRETFIRRIEHHHTLSSTNDFAAEYARRRSADLPLLVVADEQTAGRGRGANRWWSGPGALMMSLLVDAELVAADQQRSPLVALATATAVVDTVMPLLPAHRVGIHWPNDVLASFETAEERKVTGILVEVLPDRRHVIGIGVNTNNTLADAPPELRTTACTIRDFTGAMHRQTDILVRLLQCLERDFARLRADPAGIVDRVNALCLQRGRMLTVESGSDVIAGQCQGVDIDGALLLETPSGTRRIVSGTVRR